MPTPTIPKGNDYFNTVLWTGNGSSPRAFTGIGFAPNFAWIKSRSTAADNALIDSVRGTGSKALVSNTTSAENGDGLVINSFDSDGYTLATGAFNFSYANTNAANYVSWNWKAGGAAVTNTAGSISAQVSANTTAGFSIVGWTGNGSVATLGHGLGVAPKMIFGKRRDGVSNWFVYHVSLGATAGMNLNTTDAALTNSGWWNNTAPTSSVFTMGTFESTNGSPYIAYCFSEIDGYSKFGSYTGNGSTDGPFVYTGFRPRFILLKSTSSGNNWEIFDSARNPYNQADLLLLPSSSAAESGAYGSYYIDFVSNGFKIRGSGGGFNASGETMIYATFAENPFKYANAR